MLCCTTPYFLSFERLPFVLQILNGTQRRKPIRIAIISWCYAPMGGSEPCLCKQTSANLNLDANYYMYLVCFHTTCSGIVVFSVFSAIQPL